MGGAQGAGGRQVQGGDAEERGGGEAGELQGRREGAESRAGTGGERPGNAQADRASSQGWQQAQAAALAARAQAQVRDTRLGREHMGRGRGRTADGSMLLAG